MQKFEHPVAVAYCSDNESFAQKIKTDLASVIDIQLLGITRDQATSLTEMLANFEGPIVLLISDNFLRSTKCMEQGLAMFNAHQHDLLPVVIPGFRTLEDGSQEPVATSFERVTDIIQYINFWQDRYLDLRKQKREDAELDNPSFTEYFNIVRDISAEAGEYIRLLRAMMHLTDYEFVYNEYEQLFIFLEEEDLGAAFREMKEVQPPAMPLVATAEEEEEAPPVDLASIPGITLLDDNSSTINTTETEEVEEEIADLLEHEEEIELEVAEETELEEEPMVATEEPVEDPILEPALEATEDEETTQNNAEEDVALLIKKAWQLTDQGEVASGIILLESGLDHYPSDETLRFTYAILLAQDKQSEAAAEQVDLLLQSHPDHQDALFLAGELADVRGDGAAAKHFYQRVLSIDENYAEAWLQLGHVVMAYEPAQAEEAATYYKKANTLSDACYYLAMLYKGPLAQPEKAKKYLQRTIEIEPTYPLAHYDLALLLHAEGDFKHANQAYQSAIMINPEVKTPENDAAFMLMSQKSELKQEQDTLKALKDNIQQLEALISQREELENMPEERAGTDKCVLITGATAGIGRATAEKFAAAGYRLIITGRRKERLLELQEKWASEYDTEVYPLCFDVRDVSAVFAAIESLPAAWQDIDILINNAGKAKGFDPIHTGQIPHWEEMIDTNIKGLLYLTRAVTPGMVKRGRGHVINLASTAGKEVYPNGNVYCATKFAVDALTKAMRLDLHTFGIRVSQICPAAVEETEFALVRFDGDGERAKIYEGFQPLRARDVADTIYYIAQQPPHVNILDVVMQATQQASSTVIDRSGRDRYMEEEE